MPVVESYGQPRVRTSPLAGQKRTAALTPDALGGQFGETLSGVGRALGREALRVQADERQRADQLTAVTAERQFTQLDSQLLHAPDRGLLTKTGNEPMELRDTYLQEWDQQADEILKAAKTPEQQLVLARLRDNHRGAFVDRSGAHASQQLKVYEDGEYNAGLQTAIDAGIAAAGEQDAAITIADQLGKQQLIIEAYAQRRNLGPEAYKLLVEKSRSDTHVGVIGNLLAKQRDVDAKEYYDEVRDQIAGPQRAKLEHALEEGNLRARSQQKADAIILAGGTLADQREKVRKITDASLRDAVEQRIEHEATIRDRQEREQRESELITAYDLVDARGSVHAIPPTLWTSLPGSARSALRNYAENLARGTPVKTDLPTYYGFMQQAATNPDAFSKVNLLEKRHLLDETEFKQLANLQLAIRAGDKKKVDDQLDGFRTNQQILDDSLRLASIDTSDTEKSRKSGDVARVAQFRGEVDRRVTALQRQTGKKATNEDVQRIGDALLVEVFAGGAQQRVFEVAPQELPSWARNRLAAAEIPAAERRLIDDALRRAGQPVNDETRLGLYLEMQLARSRR